MGNFFQRFVKAIGHQPGTHPGRRATMSTTKIVHVVGTGTIGEPLIGLLTAFAEPLGLEEVTFHKRTPLVTDRSKVVNLMKRGAKLCVDRSAAQGFKELAMTPAYETAEALE